MSTSAAISPLFDPPEPTTEQTLDLLKKIEKKFPSATLGTDKWYLVALAALTYIEPNHAATLYSYLISQPEYTTPSSRQSLIRRLRECLMQQTSLLGVCKPLEALISIIKLEAPADRDQSFSRENWQAGPQNLANGDAWLRKVYKGNIDDIDKIFEYHKDFLFINHQITYGFYLSDMSILGEIETELSVFSGIAVQNLPLETRWHLRGLRRVGVSSEDVEVVQSCVEMVAEYGDGDWGGFLGLGILNMRFRDCLGTKGMMREINAQRKGCSTKNR